MRLGIRDTRGKMNYDLPKALNEYFHALKPLKYTNILGSGALLCFILVTPMILLAYAVEGRKNVQATSIDALFCFAGACVLIAVGGTHSSLSAFLFLAQGHPSVTKSGFHQTKCTCVSQYTECSFINQR